MAIARISGWRHVARRYGASEPCGGPSFRMRSGRFGPVKYRGMLFLAADPAHLHVSVLPLFRVGHSPFSVPWSDLAVSLGTTWMGPVARFTFAGAPGSQLTFSLALGEEIADASGGQLRV